MRKFKGILLQASVVAIGQTLATAAVAQVADPATTPSETQAGSAAAPAVVDDIIVTARKREERLRDVPVAITALDAQALQSRNITQVVDLTVTVPSLSYTTASTAPQLVIRGVGSGTNEGFDQSTAKFINNVYFGLSHDAKIPIFDVERVEVLKGPQVIAFGNSATAGALSFTTTKPGDEATGNWNAVYDFEAREIKIQGGSTLPIAEGVSLRIAGIFDDLAHGPTYNALTDEHESTQRTYGVRGSLRLDPAPGVQVDLLGEYSYFSSFGALFQPIRQPLAASGRRYPEIDDKDLNNISYDRAPIFSDAFLKTRSSLWMANVGIEAFGGDITSTTAYRDQRNLVQHGLPGPNYDMSFFQHSMSKYNQFSQELRFNGTYGALDIFVDGYYERSNRHLTQANAYFLGSMGLTGSAAIPIHRIQFYDHKYDKLSGAIDSTLRLGGGFSISAGIRYSHYKKDAGQSAFGAEIVPNLGFNTTRDDFLSYSTAAANERLRTTPSFGAVPHVFAPGSLKLRDTHWQPQAILQYKFGENMLYVKYVKGDKVGGFDTAYGPANPANIAFDKEGSEAFEGGFKGVTADRKLEYTLAIFRETFTGLQQSFLSGITNSFLVTNAGTARSQGVELDLSYRPVQPLRLTLSGAYLDAKFTDYPDAPCNTNQIAAQGSACRQDRTGTPLQMASKWTGNLNVNYEHPIGDYKLNLGGTLFARTKFNAGAVNDPGAVQKGFAMVDALANFGPDGGWWRVGLYGRNLTNKRYLNYVISPPGNATALLSGYERGRQLGLTFEAKY